ncbi:MAG: aminodeoxychorismate/anthranilate synthase component II [Leptospiraceae bacterium]|nr:aminodeoxychorismate/anthranilate synthase component II [Leptospiraceae bacterium]MDW8305680.1 aminodeoxychorismate/anthranilate synthase component II [Leptospiraceae bacterium]
MRVLIIDNYDSFTYNLYQYVGELLEERTPNFQLDVIRNDEKKVSDIEGSYDKIIISPGPGHPADKKYFGICGEVIRTLGKKTPILGVCLGMQGMAAVFGGKVVRAHTPMHGKTSFIEHDGQGVFEDLPQRIEVMRYHSLIVSEDYLPPDFVITARTVEEPREIMGIRHKFYPLEGIQFHPESFGTEGGKQMLANFLFRT